jgi:hypothetical protein
VGEKEMTREEKYKRAWYKRTLKDIDRYNKNIEGLTSSHDDPIGFWTFKISRRVRMLADALAEDQMMDEIPNIGFMPGVYTKKN